MGRIGASERISRNYDAIVRAITTDPTHALGFYGLRQEERLLRAHLLAHPAEVSALIAEGLRHPIDDVRRWMARTLPHLDPETATHLLRGALSDRDSDVRTSAAVFLFKHGETDEAVIETLRELVRSGKPYQLWAALDCLVSAPADQTARTVELIKGRLPERDWNSRHRLLSALQKLGTSSREVLIAFARHPDLETRHDSCLHLSPPDATNELLRILEDEGEHPRVRGVAGLSLARGGVGEAAGPLLRAFGHPERINQHDVLSALGHLHPDSAVKPLIARVLDNGSELRSWAIKALGRYGQNDAIEAALIARLPAEDPYISYEMIEALASVGTSRSVSVLEQFLKKKAKGLSKYRRKHAFRSVPRFIEALRRRSCA
jgi:HEAT repeat protein